MVIMLRAGGPGDRVHGVGIASDAAGGFSGVHGLGGVGLACGGLVGFIMALLHV